ncbi:uncharacterized protein LOC129969256 isoform X1 [Argiope bruennichi]|uniref:uncharacterized protein LOC129969256 isoform X1 n=1 Tax=Argiope bruennichi TaxID=94029 RepID=UPI002494AAE4|nr:uncharacterized protein LOC129969256 isoform X1 [Argiope bruennichi]
MFGQVLSVFASFWIFSAIAAPMEMEEGGMMPVDNLTQSCLGNLLPEELKPHYNTCMENMGEVEKVEELLLCVLKAHGLVPETEEESIPAFPMVEVAEAEPQEEPFVMAHQECLATEDVIKGKIDMLMSCLIEKLKMKCASMNEEEMMEEAVAEK